MQKETKCVHSGRYRDPETRGVNTPIFTSSSYEYLDRETCPYPRYFNTPNQKAVVSKLCALENAEDGLVFSSGLAAMSTTLLAIVGSGDHVVMQDELYGGTHAFATSALKRLGIRYSFAATDADSIIQAVLPETKAIIIESPTNPLLGIVDIRRVADFARNRGITTIIDNTFASPINQNPLALGIDVVVHSGTKYFGGHSDLCCGAVLTSSEKAARIRDMGANLGGVLDPTACYLLERSLKTLALRVERQTDNAGKIAAFLASHKSVRTVNYPGLTNFRGHEIARLQMTGFGAMLSFELRGTAIAPSAFLRNLRLITPAVSLGGVETLICSPAQTSHAKMSAEDRKKVGIVDSLLRLSVGIENVDDLFADLDQALSRKLKG